MPKVELFTVVEDAQVILRVRRVYRQGKLYTRGEQLFVGCKGGYVRLLRQGATTEPDTTWLGINVGDDGILPTAHEPTKGML